MEYLAHRDEASGREQSLKEHLENTAELSGNFAQKFGAYRWGYCAGMLHDIGKYSQKFQRRLWEVRKRQIMRLLALRFAGNVPMGISF